MSHWSVSKPLVFEYPHHWILTETPLGYPTTFPSHGDPMCIIPQDPSLHELQQVLYGLEVSVGQPKVGS